MGASAALRPRRCALLASLGAALVGGAVHRREPAKTPSGWEASSHALPGNTKRQVLFSIKMASAEALDGVLPKVSDPSHAEYGNYLSTADMCKMTASEPARIRAVEAWLEENNVPYSKLGCGADILADFTLDMASKVMNTTFEHLVHGRTKQTWARAGAYSVPDDVQDAVDSIFGMHGLPLVRRIGRLGRERPVSLASSGARGAPAVLPTDLVALPNVTPPVIRDAYKISDVAVKDPHGTKGGGVFSGARRGVFELQETISTEDLALFFERYAPGAGEEVASFYPDKASATAAACSPSPAAGGCEEAALDIQYIMGTVPGIPTYFFNFNGSDFVTALKVWTSHLISAGDERPLVNSASYGLPELNLEDEQGISLDNVLNIERDFQKLSSMGASMIVSSGDSGSSYHQIERYWCQSTGGFNSSKFVQGQAIEGVNFDSHVSVDNNTELDGFISECCERCLDDFLAAWQVALYQTGENEYTKECTLFYKVYALKANPAALSVVVGGDGAKTQHALSPCWPASSKFVTAVGATMFQHGDASQPEMAVGVSKDFLGVFGSGGGFSTIFSRPEWQLAAAEEYFAQPGLQLPDAALYTGAGRATPDVATLGANFEIILGGQTQHVSGTSCAAPLFASIVSGLNEVRRRSGLKPLGFLNPLLYSAEGRASFTDITVGDNRYRQFFRKSSLVRTKEGWDCSEGWDPASGLGTPDFGSMLARLANQSAAPVLASVRAHRAGQGDKGPEEEVDRDFMIALQTGAKKRQTAGTGAGVGRREL